MLPTRSHGLSIRRIVAAAIVLICLGVNVLAVWYVAHEHKLIENTITTLTAEHGQAWVSLCREPLLTGDVSNLQAILEAIGQSKGVQLALVSDEQGQILAATDRRRIGQRLHSEHHDLEADEHHLEELHPSPSGFFHESGHTFQLSFPIEHQGRGLGTLTLQVNTALG